MKEENGKLIVENGDLSFTTLKKVYDTSFSLSMAQQKRRVTTAERLAIIRKRNKLTQKELCNKIGVVLTTYSGYEKGKHDIPTEVIARICRLFDISSDYIIGLSENPKGRFAEDTDKIKEAEKQDDLRERIEALEKALKLLSESKAETDNEDTEE